MILMSSEVKALNILGLDADKSGRLKAEEFRYLM